MGIDSGQTDEGSRNRRKFLHYLRVKRRCLDEKVLTREYQGGHTRLRFA